MSYFKPAVRENVNLLIALAGASGSGKTYSALRLAKGIGGKIAFIDTEARRGLHYADQFDFLHADLCSPFAPARFGELVKSAEDAGASIIIVDSFSHEYDGDGGIVDLANKLEAAGTKPPLNWKEPKLRHKTLVNAFLQCRSTLIFCLRADEKISVERKEVDGRVKTVIVPLGWVPICEKRFMYEMTASFTLDPADPGRPKFNLPHKCQSQHRAFFPEGQLIDERAGQLLAKWAAGGASNPCGQMPLINQGEACAAGGVEILKQFWDNLTPSERKEVGGRAALDRWKGVAIDADINREPAIVSDDLLGQSPEEQR